MFFGFNLVDVLVFIFIATYGFFTYKRGFLSELLELIAFTISLLCALVFFPFVSFLLQNLSLQENLANTFSFLGIWVSTEFFLLRVNRDIFKEIPMRYILSKANRYLGIIPNLLSSLLLISFLGTLLMVLPTNSQIKAQVTQSKITGQIVVLTKVFNNSLENAFANSLRDSLIFLTKNDSEQKFIKLNLPKDLVLTEDYESEKKLLALLNLERAKRGLNQLREEVTMAFVARKHSEDMFKKNYFGHLDPNGNDPLYRISKTGLNFESLAENLSYAPDAQTAHEGLMDSDSHREAILSPKFSRVGIGVVDSGSYGKMITQFFAD